MWTRMIASSVSVTKYQFHISGIFRDFYWYCYGRIGWENDFYAFSSYAVAICSDRLCLSSIIHILPLSSLIDVSVSRNCCAVFIWTPSLEIPKRSIYGKKNCVIKKNIQRPQVEDCSQLMNIYLVLHNNLHSFLIQSIPVKGVIILSLIFEKRMINCVFALKKTKRFRRFALNIFP